MCTIIQIGLLARNITPALASGLGLDREEGVLIEDVLPEGPARSRRFDARRHRTKCERKTSSKY